MCPRSSTPQAEVNRPNHSVAQMGQNYQFTTSAVAPEDSEDEEAKAAKVKAVRAQM